MTAMDMLANRVRKNARHLGIQPQIRRVSAIGIVLVPLSIAAALGATALLTSGRL